MGLKLIWTLWDTGQLGQLPRDATGPGSSTFSIIPHQPSAIPPLPMATAPHWPTPQVYVLKRPHVDEFLQRMGELFECVLFTASLAKVSPGQGCGVTLSSHLPPACSQMEPRATPSPWMTHLPSPVCRPSS